MSFKNTSLAVPYVNASEACRDLLNRLNISRPMDLWMVTRRIGDEWIVLESTENPYGISRGFVSKWSESVCSRMVEHDGPMAVGDVGDVDLYKDAEIRGVLDFKSYIGIPILDGNEKLFGTLCGIDRQNRSPEVQDFASCALVFVKMISTIMVMEGQADAQRRSAQRFLAQNFEDSGTGFLNHFAFEETAKFEDELARKYGHDVGVILIDLEREQSAGRADRATSFAGLLSVVAATVRYTLRLEDFAGRLNETQIVVILPDIETGRLDQIGSYLREFTFKATVGTRIVWTTRDRRRGLLETIRTLRMALAGVTEDVA